MSSWSQRPLLPKPPTDEGYDGGKRSAPTSSSQKREMVRVACQACRARKIKCDARRPTCSPCITRSRTCEYETEADVDRYTSLKRKHSRLEKDHSELLELFDMLKFRPTRDAQTILDLLKSTDDLGGTISLIKQGDLLMQNAVESEAKSPKSSMAASLLATLHPLAYPALGPLGGEEACLGEKRMTVMQSTPGWGNILTQDDIDATRDLSRGHRLIDHRLSGVRASRWTSVTDDDAAVANLISMYLSWDHASCRIFDENYFIEHLLSGEEGYCSALLVNAILAVATLNYKAVAPRRSSELCTRFREETGRLWQAEQSAGGLMLVPASILLDSWSKASGEEAKGYQCLQRGLQVASDLGLFDQTSGTGRGDAISRKVRKGTAIIAWGLFNWLALDSLIVQRDDRFKELPGMAIPEDAVSIGEDVAEWDSFPLVRTPQLLDRHLAQQTLSTLCIVLHQHIDLRSVVQKAKDEEKPALIEDAKAVFVNLLDWADNLPSTMTRSAECLPLVIDMHMFFHTAVVDLFGRFSQDDGSSGALGREVTDASLAQLRRLLYIQRYRFGGAPQSSTTLYPIRLLTADLLERIALAEGRSEEEAEFYLILCMDALLQLSACYPATKTILRDVVERADAVGIRLPEEVLTMLRSVGEAYFRRPAAMNDAARGQFDLDLEMAMSDPSEAVMEWLEQAAGRLRLR